MRNATDLESIGFYTLCNSRAETAWADTELSRCEIVLTAKCNFKCPYCRGVGGSDIPFGDALWTITNWAVNGVKAIRLSGGEPTLYKDLPLLVSYAANCESIDRIAVSSNGSASQEYYQDLITRGVNDFSISLDACSEEDCDRMTGIKGMFTTITENIKWLSSKVYTTVGVVVTPANIDSLNDIIHFADGLGVSDIRIIPAAQEGCRFEDVYVDAVLLAKYPILAYRIANMQNKKTVRGLCSYDSKRCGLVLDDMAVNNNMHFPCIIYMRESGAPIGSMDGDVRADRLNWYMNHDTKKDPICANNCLDVCVHYNNMFETLNKRAID